jgi:hypothetical protein
MISLIIFTSLPVIYVGLDSAGTVKRKILDLRRLVAESGLILVLLEFCGYSRRLQV